MKSFYLFIMTAILICGLFTACNEHHHGNEHSSVATGQKAPHNRDYEGGEGEEEGTMLAISERYDMVNNGVHLIMAYDEANSRFSGSMENVSKEVLNRARVEIHLSNGKELGPTIPVSLQPGEKITIELDAAGQHFDKWNTHAEIGSSEHKHGHHTLGEHGTEHREHDGEHGEHSERSHEHGGEHL